VERSYRKLAFSAMLQLSCCWEPGMMYTTLVWGYQSVYTPVSMPPTVLLSTVIVVFQKESDWNIATGFPAFFSSEMIVYRLHFCFIRCRC